jgi:hypothetical protein
MTERQLSAADAALRERITELSVHIPCGGLRGPVTTRYRTPSGQITQWQSCRDEDTPEKWEGCDVSHEHDLCIICARATAGGTSRWSWLACGNCRAVNDALESAWGFRPFALGRHSIMNGIAVRGGTSPEVRAEQLARLNEFRTHVHRLREWEHQEFSRLAVGFDADADIPLRLWQERWVPSRSASWDAFTRLSGSELPRMP